jgi:endonuclease III
VIVHKNLQDIVENCGGKIPTGLAEWTCYHEMDPKTVALLLWAFAGIETTIPVDSHVFLFIHTLCLTNAKSEDECSWQMQKYASKGDFIRINNSIGGLGQTMATPGGRKRVIAATNRRAPKELQQLMLALRDKYATTTKGQK